MRALIENLNARIDALLLRDRQRQLEALELDVVRLERELAELRQRIPFWDRVVFFSDTADEARAKELDQLLTDRRQACDDMRRLVRDDLDALGEVYPPYAVAQKIRDCRALARALTAAPTRSDGVAIPDDLTTPLVDTLEAIGDLIAATWLADFDPEALRRVLWNPQARTVYPHAGAPFDDRHPTLGWAPITQADLLAASVRAIERDPRIDGVRAEQTELEAKLALADTSLTVADERVSVWDRLNPFSSSIAELQRDAAQAELAASQRAYAERSAEFVYRLEEALGVFPPVAVQLAAHTALGAVRALDVQSELVIAADGSLREIPTAAGRPLVIAAVERLAAAFARAFPGVPVPLGPTDPPRTPVERELARALDRTGAGDEVDSALRHAYLRHAAMVVRNQVQARVSWIDRAIFWSDTDDEATSDRLAARIAWYDRGLADAHIAMRRQAQNAGADLLALFLRDWTIWTMLTIQRIRTDSGTTSSRRSCSVYGAEETRAALQALRDHIERRYGFRGGRRTFLRDVAELVRRRATGDEPPTEAFRVLPYEEVVRRVAYRLRDTGFDALFDAVEAASTAHTHAQSQRGEAEAAISIWDRINIFTTTAWEAQAAAYEAEMKRLDARLAGGLARLDELVEDALGAYPPARLYYRLDAVATAVDEIRAFCRSRTVSSGTGAGRTTRTEYYCVLSGVDDALEAARWWNRAFIAVFGDVPTYEQLLSSWLLQRG